MTKLILSAGFGDTGGVACPVADPKCQFRGQGSHHNECIRLGVPHVLLMPSFGDDVMWNGSQVGLLPKLDELGIIEWAVLIPHSWLVRGEGCHFAQGPGQLACDRDQ